MDEENLKRLQYELENRSKVTIVLESSLMLLIIITSFIGNSLIIFVVFQNPRLRTVTNIFLVSLAIADILTSLLVMPFSASIFIQGKWIFSEGVCVFQGVSALCLVWISLHLVALMAINRYYCVRRRSIYRKWFTKRFTLGVIAAVSILPLVLAISPYLGGSVTYIFRPGKASCFMTFDPSRQLGKIAYTIFLLLIYTVLPTTIIAVCYYKVFRTVKQHFIVTKNTIRSRSRHQNGDLSSEELRTTKLLLGLVFAFVVCWTPVIAVDFLNAIMGTGRLPRGAYVAYSIFAFGSSCINPIVCLTLNSKIRRKAMNVVFFKRLRRVGTNEEPTKEKMPELTVIRMMRRKKMIMRT